MGRLTHTDEDGAARMIDVGAKAGSARRAVAEGRVRFGPAAYEALRDNRLAKGDALAVARLAGIQAAKRTAEWIPLCHSVPLDHVDVRIAFDDRSLEARVTADASARWTTGVEMEAMTAVSAACLALYDMTKSVERGIEIVGVRLVEKHGGRSGSWTRTQDDDRRDRRRGGTECDTGDD